MCEQRLTLLYTANILGQLDRLPRLFTLLQERRTAAAHPTLLLDLGNSCQPEAALCAATDGRAALLIFDAMGYDGACLTVAECQQTGDEARQKLREAVQLSLCGPLALGFATWNREPFKVIFGSSECQPPLFEAPTGMRIVVFSALEAAANRWLAGTQHLYLAALPGDVVGSVTFTYTPSDQQLAIHFEKISLTAEYHPDSTITAAVDFVKEEARLYQRQAARQQAHDMGGKI